MAERAFERYVVDENGCHISTYSVQSRGFAHISWKDDDGVRVHSTTAQRAAWTHVHGPIEGDLEVNHPDSGKRCVNVDHLRLLTPVLVRIQQGNANPLGFCKRGHPDSDRVINIQGRWICVPCRRLAQRAHYQRTKVQELAHA